MKLMHRKMSRVMERCSRWVKSGCMRRHPTGIVAPFSALSSSARARLLSPHGSSKPQKIYNDCSGG